MDRSTPQPPVSGAQAAAIHEAAGKWADREGFAGVAAVPAHRLLELIADVSAVTQIAEGGVRDTVLAAAQAAVERSRVASAALGGAPRAQAVLPPVGRARATLARDDRSFTQTIEDFQATRIAVTAKASPRVLRELGAGAARLLTLFGQLEGAPSDKQLREEIITLYRDLISQATRDRGIFLVKGDAVAKVEAMPVDPPVLLHRREAKASRVLRENAAQRVQNLREAIQAEGRPELDPRRGTDLGDVPAIAVDAATGRRFVYDFHGEVDQVLTLEQLAARYAAAPAGDVDDLADLRSLSDKGLARLNGPIAYVSLDEGPRSVSARVYPTRWHKAQGTLLRRRMICEGPYRGIYLDDLANKLAPRDRAYAYDPKHGATAPFAPAEGEPLVTTAMVRERGQKVEKLYVRIPFEHEWTEVRQALRKLTVLEPSITYHEGTKNCGFHFGPENYGAVRDVLRGMVLSKQALGVLETYFDELTRVELAAADKNLGRHTAAAIGGFRRTVRDAEGRVRRVETTYWQKKALAWLEARDHRGVISLDTGMGKTLVAIAAMLELRARHKVKAPFLIVCPPALRGNFPKEIHKFLDEDAAKALLENVRIMSYPQFAKAKDLDVQAYGAVIFDEAQWLKNPRSTRTKAALAFKHPRTICLTASPMENSPMEAYVLACVAGGINLNDRKEGREHRRRMRKFKELYCETLGGRILGVKQSVELLPKVVIDPKHNLYTWVRSNLFFADKKVDDTRLAALRLSTETLTMPRGMEIEYRKKARRILNVMRGMVSMYRDKGILREYVDEKGRTRREINPLARNKKIAQMFGVRFAGVLKQLNELTNTSEKIDRAAELIWKRLEANPRSRTVLFSDSSDFVVRSAQSLSEKIPVKVHAACLGTQIRLFRDGAELKEYRGHALPFVQKEYQSDDRVWPESEWQQFVLSEVIGEHDEVATATMFGPVYQQGQNLQWANTGIHLDRDTWNRENTKQREARLWRKGQMQKVEFYNIDWVYKKPRDSFDRTLDEIRALYEIVAEDLFHQIIEVPQKAVMLGEEWSPVRSIKTLDIDREMLELGVVPTAKTAGAAGTRA